MSFSRYPSYKASGVELPREVPDHWTISKMKWVATMESGHTPDKKTTDYWENGDIPWVSLNDTTYLKDNDYISDTTYCVTELGIANSSAHLIPTGAVVFSRDATIGRCAITTRPMAVSQHFIAWICGERIRPEFLLLRLKSMHQELDRLTAGATIKTIGMPEVRTLTTPVPPIHEQDQIISFIRRETTKIDALVDEQQQLIELLEEKRQAIISQKVTKGLNPDTPMKSSGVEWIGEIPKHWDIGRIKHYFNTASGGTPNTSQTDIYYTNEIDGIPWIRTTDIDNGPVSSAEVFITPQAISDTACKLLPRSSVLVAMYGGVGTVGKNGILTIEAAINQALCAILPSDAINSLYLLYYIQFYRPYWMIEAESSRKASNISQELIRNAPCVVPPLQEQDTIVHHLRIEIAKLDALIDEAQFAIGFLQERRSTLISAAVNGQIDVRALAERQPT